MTYSIIAKCSETGQYGVGIQSHFYAAGNACWANAGVGACLLYTSPSPRDGLLSRMPSSA